MDKKKKIAGIALAIAVFLIIGARICYVTAHARLPEQNVIAQGDSLTYRGLTYQIKGAVLWNYEDCFKEHRNIRVIRNRGLQEKIRSY